MFPVVGTMIEFYRKEFSNYHTIALISHASKGKESEVAQSCLTLCDPIDCSLPGSSVHGIFQAILLEWIAISFSRGSSQPRDQTRVSHIVDRRLPSEPPGKSFFLISLLNFLYLFRGYYSISVWFLFYFLG